MSSNKLTSRIASQYMANLEKKSFAEGPEGQKQFAESVALRQLIYGIESALR